MEKCSVTCSVIMQSTDTVAYGVLRDHFATICESEIDPIRLGNSLFEARIINAGTRDEAATQGRRNMHLRTLVDAVMRQGRPGAFQRFVEIAGQDPKCKFHNQLKEMYISSGGGWVGSEHQAPAGGRHLQVAATGGRSSREQETPPSSPLRVQVQWSEETHSSHSVQASRLGGGQATHPVKGGALEHQTTHSRGTSPKARDIVEEDDHILNLKVDLFTVRSALLPVASRWAELALFLGVDYSCIEEIKARHGGVVGKCVTEVAVRWLRGGGRQKPCWKQLVEVIAAEMGGNNPAYAEQVANYAFMEDCPKFCCDTDTTVLDARFHGEVVTELWSIADRWKEIGIFLGVDYDMLESYDRREPKDALGAVLEAWLARRYDCVAFGYPTWRKLVEAVHSKAGAADHTLASKMAVNKKKRS